MRVVPAARDLPPDDLVSAVFLIALKADTVLSVLVDRGWDIPGGHVEPGETLSEALRREVMEEAAATFDRAEPCAIVEAPPRREVMLLYATSDYTLGPFTATHHALDRAVVGCDEFLRRYRGPTQMMRELLDRARSQLSR